MFNDDTTDPLHVKSFPFPFMVPNFVLQELYKSFVEFLVSPLNHPLPPSLYPSSFYTEWNIRKFYEIQNNYVPLGDLP